MKKTKLILGSIALTALVGSFYLNNKIGTISERSYYSETLSKDDVKRNGWTGASEYLNSLYVNPLTGKVEPADYDLAYQQAQNMISAKAASFTFAEDGPDNVGGRTRAIIVDVNNDNIVYAGSVDGGMYKSANGGNTWNRLSSWDVAASTMSISSICMTTNGTLYVATGGGSMLGEGGLDYEGSGMQNGDGVWYSTDGGSSFLQLSGTAGSEISRVTADLSKNDVFYFTGSGQALKRVTNASTIEDLSATTDIIGSLSTINVSVSPDGNVIICTGSSHVYVSVDGGASFVNSYGSSSTVPSPIPSGGSRKECAVSYDKTSNGTYNLYVAEAAGGGTIRGIWISEDYGQNWYRIAPPSTTGWTPCISANGQCYYDMVIDAVPGHPDHCIFGGIDLYRWQRSAGSDPSNGQWEQISQWNFPLGDPRFVHADNHRITWDSNGSMYVGNDGGIFKSFDNTTSFFTPVNKGYNATQFYGIGYGPNGEVIGGAQDNGTQYNDHTSLNGMSYADVNGGDGFECEISYMSDGNAIISTIYGGAVFRSDDKGNNWQGVSAPGAGSGFYNAVRLFEDENDTDTKDSIQFIPSYNMVTGDTVTYYSETFDLPLYHVLTQGLVVWYEVVIPLNDSILPNFDTIPAGVPYYYNPTAQDTIMLPDTKQSLFVTYGNAIYLTRDMMRFASGTEWWKLNVTGTAQSYEFSKDGNTLWIGSSTGKLTRVTGLDSAYSYEAADASNIPTTSIINIATGDTILGGFTFIDYSAANYRYFDSTMVTYKLGIKTVVAGGNTITDISTDPNNLDRVIFSTGTTAGTVKLCTNARAATPTFTDIGGNVGTTGLPSYPVFGCEFINNMQGTDIIMVGTEFGAYSTDNPTSGTPTWSTHTNETGIIPVFDVRQQWRDATKVNNPYEVYLGTFARGIWRSDSYLSVSDSDAVIEDVADISGIRVYPNPLSSDGNIAFELGSRTDVEFKVYDLQGKIVNQVVWKNMNSGKHSMDFSVDNLPSGTYLVTLKVGSSTEVTKFIKY